MSSLPQGVDSNLAKLLMPFLKLLRQQRAAALGAIRDAPLYELRAWHCGMSASASHARAVMRSVFVQGDQASSSASRCRSSPKLSALYTLLCHREWLHGCWSLVSVRRFARPPSMASRPGRRCEAPAPPLEAQSESVRVNLDGCKG